MKKININKMVKVRLDDFGKDIYYHRYDELNEELARVGVKTITPHFPKVDENGFSEFQLWDFMQLYGQYFVLGMPEPILEDLNFYFNEKDLKDVEE